MSKHHHKHPHIHPNPRPSPHHPNDPGKTGDRFVAVVGKVAGPLGDSDNNHVSIPLRVSVGNEAGTYHVQFNVESTNNPKDAQYHIIDETIKPSDLPQEGVFADAQLDYKQLGLHESDFKIIQNGNLRTVVHSSVDRAEIMEAYGFTYPGLGVHMIHFNNGEKPGSAHSNHPHQDGALAIYYRDGQGAYVRRWIFLKFQSQSL